MTTAKEWCQQITGVDPSTKKMPPWAVLERIPLDADSIRHDFAKTLNDGLMGKVESRAERMAWVERTNLHIESLATLMEVDPETIIVGWGSGLERGKSGRTADDADQCLFGSVASLFDSVFIHTGIWDPGRMSIIKDSVVAFAMDRRARLKNPL